MSHLAQLLRNPRYKTDTDLYELAKKRAMPRSIAVSPTGDSFVVTCSDCKYRVFRFLTAKLRRVYDESPRVFEEAHRKGSLPIDNIDFGQCGRCTLGMPASVNLAPDALTLTLACTGQMCICLC